MASTAAGLTWSPGIGAGGAHLDAVAGQVAQPARRPSGSGRRCGRRRTGRWGCSGHGVLLRTRRVEARARPRRRVQLGEGPVEGGVGADAAPGRAPTSADRRPTSSWARSQTVMTRSPSARTSSIDRGRSRGNGRCGARRRPRPGMDALGRVGAGGRRRHRAGPAPERRGQVGAGGVGGADEQHPLGGRVRARRARRGGGHQAEVGAAPVALGAVPVDQAPPCSTLRWWASRLDGMSQHRGQLRRCRVATASASTMRRRAGSARAACSAARRSTIAVHLNVHCLNVD